MCSPPLRTPPGVGRTARYVDRTGDPFVTLDPVTSRDLDQAFTIDRAGEDLVLHYAIADVGFFVDPGDPVDAEAWRRGVTVFLPGRRAPLYPPVLSEAAASLLPDGPRPSVVFTVRVRPDGDAAPRRRRTGRDPQPGQARLRQRHDGGAAGRLRRARPPHRARRGAPGCRSGRVPRAGAQPHRRRSGPPLPAPQREREPERGAVARHEPRRRRDAPRRRHGTVPGDAGARRAGDPPSAPQRQGVRVDVAARSVAGRLRSAPCGGRTRAMPPFCSPCARPAERRPTP